MNYLLIANSNTYAEKVGGGTISGASELDDLAVGALAIINTKTGALITTANAGNLTATDDEFYVAIGREKGARLSPSIPRRTTTYNTCDYAAPVRQAVRLGGNGTTGDLNLPASLVPDTVGYIRIYDRTVIDETGHPLDLPVGAERVKAYEVFVRPGDDADDIITRLTATVNADPNSLVTAAATTGANGGILFTAKEDNVIFEVVTDEILKYADNAVATGVVYGKGTVKHLARLEAWYSAERGNTNQLYLPQKFYNVPSELSSNGTYDLIGISFESTWKKHPAPQVTGVPQVEIAVPAGGALKTAVTTIFTAIIDLLNV